MNGVRGASVATDTGSSGALQLGAFQLSTRPLVAGAVMIGAGAVVAAAGLVISGAVVLTATKRWIDQLETPPTELARQKWQQAKAASAAGASAWQDENGVTAGSHRS